jgi:cobaltochelatase CobS
MENQTDYRLPPHKRLDSFSVKHLLGVLRDLMGGTIGFDPARDDRTNTKRALCDFIRGGWTAEQIDAAHARVVQNYGGGEYGRFKGRNRRFKDNSVLIGNGEANGGQTKVENGDKSEGGQGDQSADNGQGDGQSEGGQDGQSADNGQGDGQSADNGQGDGQSEGDAKPNGKGKRKSKGGDEEGEAGDKVEREVKKLIKEALDKLEGHKRQNKANGDKGGNRQHKNFNLLLKAAQAVDADGHHLNIWLFGPAGTGKTTAARNVARALDLDFKFNSALDTGYKLTGFVDANGRVVRTPFRDAWEHGGVYLFDEVDGSAPSALIEFNAALANGAHSFPDGIIPRHPDCIIIAGANTAGLGGTSEYVGRAKQDAAFLDRFVLIDWPIDEALELAICPNKDWCKRVQAIRQKVKERGIRGVLVSPRASLYGASLLAAGLSQDQVERMTLQKAMTPEQWSQVK